MSNIDTSLKIIDRMIKEYYRPPSTYYMKAIDFLYDSYKRWAIMELRAYIKKNKNRPVIETIESFCYKMDCYACESKNGNSNFMFSIARDVGIDVLDAIISEHNQKEVYNNV